MRDFLALMNPNRWALLAGVLMLSLVGAAVGARAIYNAGYDAATAKAAAEHAEKDNAALKAALDQVQHLMDANQILQKEYNDAVLAISDLRAARSSAAGLRDAEREAIVAAAVRAASDTCGRYASAAERDIAGVEADAEAMGLRAASAAAAAHALYNAWPEYREFQKRLDAFTQQLKGE